MHYIVIIRESVDASLTCGWDWNLCLRIILVRSAGIPTRGAGDAKPLGCAAISRTNLPPELVKLAIQVREIIASMLDAAAYGAL